MNKNSKNFQQLFANQKIATVIMVMDKFFIKLPHLPKKLLVFIKTIIPWLALIGGIIGSIAVALSFLLAALSLIALDLNLIFTTLGSLLLVLLNTLFLIKAFKPLKKNNAVGWIYLFWVNILGIINSVINIIAGDITGWQQISLTILMTLIGFYILFEIGGFYDFKTEEAKKVVPPANFNPLPLNT